jgi:hypothetical protein
VRRENAGGGACDWQFRNDLCGVDLVGYAAGFFEAFAPLEAGYANLNWEFREHSSGARQCLTNRRAIRHPAKRIPQGLKLDIFGPLRRD